MRKVAKLIGKLAAWVLLLCVLVVAGSNALVLISTSDGITTADSVRNRGVDAIVVLGASVNPDGTPSDILKSRLDDAVELYQEGAARKIIASGDNGDLHYN